MQNEWLTEVLRRARERAPQIVVSTEDVDADGTATLSLGLRAVVLLRDGDSCLLSPSIATGRTIQSRLEDRVQHLDIHRYGMTDATIDTAVDAIIAHLGTGMPRFPGS